MASFAIPDDATGPLHALAQRLLTDEAQASRSICVTSSDRGEGTSTCAWYLAVYLADVFELDVLLIDANLRNPQVHALAGTGANEGLTDVLAGTADLPGALKETRLAHLRILTSGSPGTNATHKLYSARMNDVLSGARTFRFVLVDAPPVNPHPDAVRVASLCDGSVLVVGAGRTRSEAAQHAKASLENAGCRILGVVLNRRRYFIPRSLYNWV